MGGNVNVDYKEFAEVFNPAEIGQKKCFFVALSSTLIFHDKRYGPNPASVGMVETTVKLVFMISSSFSLMSIQHYVPQNVGVKNHLS